SARPTSSSWWAPTSPTSRPPRPPPPRPTTPPPPPEADGSDPPGRRSVQALGFDAHGVADRAARRRGVDPGRGHDRRRQVTPRRAAHPTGGAVAQVEADGGVRADL